MITRDATGIYRTYLSTLSFWRETPKAREPLLWTNQQTTNDQLTAEEWKYSRHSARQRWHPTNNLLEVWQHLAIFGGRSIGAIVEVLLMIVVNWQLS